MSGPSHPLRPVFDGTTPPMPADWATRPAADYLREHGLLSPADQLVSTLYPTDAEGAVLAYPLARYRQPPTVDVHITITVKERP